MASLFSVYLGRYPSLLEKKEKKSSIVNLESVRLPRAIE
jgi:hypothetical protein